MRSTATFAVISFLTRSFFVVAKTVIIRTTADAPFFDPTNTTADVGDILEFHFKAHNRSVVQGDYDRPCQPASTGGFYSGFFVEADATKENSTVFHVTVNDTNPIVYYCSQNGPDFGNHCKEHGMAGVINEPDLTRLQAYRDAAALVNTSVSPASGPFGGVFAANPDVAAVSGTSTATSPTSTPTSSAIRGLAKIRIFHVLGIAAVLSLCVPI
ncbi:hypothetical protein VPNG_10400 [Cytospora leucostoma]|uniref:Phytocyanin domain-containing protein n=1 Tax=Cytospora leucostoma TaxID=1230097 RepID=A0A423V8Z2_9PEZI|nr:hypothetical protein VPNG_10400 [Cytospora leucostoma]